MKFPDEMYDAIEERQKFLNTPIRWKNFEYTPRLEPFYTCATNALNNALALVGHLDATPHRADDSGEDITGKAYCYFASSTNGISFE